MKIKFLQDYKSYIKNSIVEVPINVAKGLIKKNIAEEYSIKNYILKPLHAFGNSITKAIGRKPN